MQKSKDPPITIMQGPWIADIPNLTCTNITNNIVVVFEKQGKGYRGKIKYISMELFENLAKQKHGEKFIRKQVEEAEAVFFRAIVETELQKQ